MRFITIAISILATASLAALTLTSRTDSATKDNTYFTDIVSTRDKALLDDFMASLDPNIMRECVARYEEGKSIDLDYLATCGDFDTYARYMRLSKFEAVKKFQHVMLNSSSKLEFEDRLAR